jgi:hypothetical protein
VGTIEDDSLARLKLLIALPVGELQFDGEKLDQIGDAVVEPVRLREVQATSTSGIGNSH